MIYVTGDLHGELRKLRGRYYEPDHELTEDDFIIVCGDFGGIWNGSKNERYWLKWLSERMITTLFVTGNHENFDKLAKYPVTQWNGGKVQFITDKIIHLMRGQIFTIQDKTFFTMGGASSHDIEDGILEKDDSDFDRKRKELDRRFGLYRINHVSWWKEELPGEAEMDEGMASLEKHNWTIDYIISHCAPTSIQNMINPKEYKPDRLTDYFETIKDKCSFKYWFFGHYHGDKCFNDKYFLLYHHKVAVDRMDEEGYQEYLKKVF